MLDEVKVELNLFSLYAHEIGFLANYLLKMKTKQKDRKGYNQWELVAMCYLSKGCHSN